MSGWIGLLCWYGIWWFVDCEVGLMYVYVYFVLLEEDMLGFIYFDVVGYVYMVDVGGK